MYRAVDPYGQVIDVYVSVKRDNAAARAFFQHAITSAGTAPVEVVTDRAPVYPKLIEELFPAAWHHSEQHANNRIEARTATVIIQGHAFVQNLRRGHYHLTAGLPTKIRLAEAFNKLSQAI